MTGLVLNLPSAFTDTTLPKIQPDPVMPQAGALWLMERAHPADTAPFALPAVAQSAAVTNLAWKQAMEALGQGSQTSLAGTFSLGSGAQGSGLAKTEMTARGGVHQITSQASDPGSQANGRFLLPTALREFLYANPTHKIFLSVWGRITRPYVTTTNAQTAWAEFVSTTSGTSNLRAILRTPSTNGVNASGNAGRAIPNAVGPGLANAMTDGWLGTAPSAASGLRANVGVLGVGELYNYTAPIRQSHASRVIYRVYGEDLTLSGRTYAQVDALDQAEYTKQVLTAGGRYYGDTFTDPATIA